MRLAKLSLTGVIIVTARLSGQAIYASVGSLHSKGGILFASMVAHLLRSLYKCRALSVDKSLGTRVATVQ